jgi:hypothetical protein
MPEEVTLSEEQEKIIVDEWNSRPDDPPSLLALIKETFPGRNLDGRSKEGRAVKKFLATRKLKARGQHEYKPKQKIELTDEQKEYIDNNIAYMNPKEIAVTIFNDAAITQTHQETRTVVEYVNSLGPSQETFQDNSEIPMSDYKPPGTFDKTVYRINKYVLHGIDKDKVTPKQKRDVPALIGYLHVYRFIHQINTYQTTVDRELFESSFVRYTYDKCDLTQEEVDEYIVLAAEVVIASNIQRRINHLSDLMDGAANDTEGRRLSMGLVSAINDAQTEYNQCVNRQQKLLSDLKEKRSDRLKKEIKNNASILNLVEMWKEEESRRKLIKLAEMRKILIKDEIQKLSSLEEVKARIMGITEDEVLNG